MGGHDVYCAICGAVIQQPYWHYDRDDDPDNEYEYDHSVIQCDDTLWMNEVQVIGENPKATAMNKVFVSGPTDYDDYGDLDVSPSDHPNFPTEDQIEFGLMMRAYDWDEEHRYAIPFHTICYRLLAEYMSRHMAGSPAIDEEVLYQTWKRLQDGDNAVDQCLGGVSYGTDTRAQYWPTKRGQEAFAMNPVDIPQLQAYLAEPPLLENSTTSRTSQPATSIPRDNSRSLHDPFATLAAELLYAIIAALPMASVNCLRAASPAVSRLDFSNRFWKQRLRHDMPWLYDVPDFGPRSSELDWAQLYADLLVCSQDGHPRQIRGLVNRRRIWGVCDQVAPTYKGKKTAKDSMTHSPLLASAISTPMRPLSWSQTGTESKALSLLDDWAELEHRHPIVLSIFWTKKGVLSGLAVQRGGAREETVGDKNRFAIRNDVKIDDHDWIRGLILTSRVSSNSGEQIPSTRVTGLKLLFIHGEPVQLGESNGDQRLVHTQRDLLLVGLLLEWSSSGPLESLSLLQASVPQDYPEAAHLARSQNTHPDAHSDIIRCTRVWKDRLPPAWVAPSERLSSHDWGDDYFKPDLSPMEALIFGYDESELSTITSISADVHFGAFEVRYSDKPPRCIGPRPGEEGPNPLAMQDFAINGAGGERIVAVAAVVQQRTTGIRIITNRGRQLVLGLCAPAAPMYASPGYHSEIMYASTQERVLCGFYCHWTGRGSPKARLECIAGLFDTRAASITTTTITPSDMPHHHWKPSPPPSSPSQSQSQSQSQSPTPTPTWTWTWTPSTPLLGAHTHTPESRITRSEAFPSPNASTTFLVLDRARPVQKVRLVITHPSSLLSFAPAGIAIEYVDGGVESVGATRVVWGTDADGASGNKDEDGDGDKKDGDDIPWCWCHYDSPHPELGKTPHYREEAWDVGRECLDALRVWVDERNAIQGMQFVSVQGAEGPRWGVIGENDRCTVLRFGEQSGADKVGLKVFMDSNARPVNHEDTVVVGMQALIGRCSST